jgi:tRNA-specific 2-thiouridylase
MNAEGRIAVAMSGGVDSSVAAALLRQSGHEVFGLMLRMHDSGSADHNRCCVPSDIAVARSVAATLGIPFHVIDAREAFENSVVQPFVRGYAQGITPNPCIECNRTVRFGLLFERALDLGAICFATGHYVRTRRSGPQYQLLTARDESKDQSYVLHVLTQYHLAHTIFPLGGLTKREVRDHAARLHLPIADRSESQDLCFVQGDYRSFLGARGVNAAPGPILDTEGNTLGTHSGLAAYTLGQRKGLGVAAGEPLYVIDKDIARNALIVGGRGAIGRQQFSVSRVHWISDGPPAGEFDTSVQVRYHAPRAEGRVVCISSTEARVSLAARHPDVAPGQSAVFYLGDHCLGGGIITL